MYNCMLLGGKDSIHNSASSWNFWNGFKYEIKGDGNCKAKRGQQKTGKTLYGEKSRWSATFNTNSM